MARQCPSDNPMSPGLFSMLKMSLQPLWSSFLLFAKKKLQLRKSALRSCWPDHSLVIKLMASNPISEDLFDREAVEEVIHQAERQAKSVLAIIGTRSMGVKRSAPQTPGRTPKKQRVQQGASQEQQTQYRRNVGYRREDKSAEEKSRFRQMSPNRKQSTPRRNTKSPRGRSQRVNTPKRSNQPGQGEASGF